MEAEWEKVLRGYTAPDKEARGWALIRAEGTPGDAISRLVSLARAAEWGGGGGAPPAGRPKGSPEGLGGDSLPIRLAHPAALAGQAMGGASVRGGGDAP